MDIESGIDFLAEAGLNLLAVFDCAALPPAIQRIMRQSGVPLAKYRRLVLIGHGGQAMWQKLQTWGMRTADPVDHYSHTLTHQFIETYLDRSPTEWLYPGTSFVVPLQQLGTAAGWSHPSPLGMGINPVYGVWFAYRAAFLTDAPLPLRSMPSTASPCDSCINIPCISTCPASAVGFDKFEVESCARHRVLPDSSCSDRCLARMACPCFPEHRYPLQQIQYHYGHSLPTLRDWYGD